MITIERPGNTQIGGKVKYLKCTVSKMGNVYLFVTLIIAIPILTALIYNIQLFQIQSFAQTHSNNNNVSNAANTKEMLNTPTFGQKVVLRGIESSKIFNNATLKTGEKSTRCINFN